MLGKHFEMIKNISLKEKSIIKIDILKGWITNSKKKNQNEIGIFVKSQLI